MSDLNNSLENQMDQFLAGDLPLDEVVAMIEHLENSSEARKTLLRLSLLETQLYEMLKLDDGSDDDRWADAVDLGPSAQHGLTSTEVSDSSSSSLDTGCVDSRGIDSRRLDLSSFSPPSTSWRWLLATAAITLAMLSSLVYWQTRNPTPNVAGQHGSEQQNLSSEDSQPMAFVSRAVNAMWSSGKRELGSEIEHGDLIELESGLAEIAFRSGARAILEGPVKLKLDGPNRASLSLGTLVATVPPEASGFRLDTPTTTVIDVGTEFGVHVDKSGVAELQVMRGEVDVETPKQSNEFASSDYRESVRISAGGYARIDAKSIQQDLKQKPRKLIRDEAFTKLSASVVIDDDFRYPI